MKRRTRVRLSLLTVSLISAAVALAQQPQISMPNDYSCSGEPVIDMHVHAATTDVLIAGLTEAPQFIAAQPNPTGEPVPSSADEYLRRALTVMDRCNVVRAFVTGNVESVATWHQASPERVIPSMDLGDPDDVQLPDIGELRALFSDGSLQGLGEVGPVYVGLSPSDSGYMPYYALAESFDVPVAIHSGEAAPGQGAEDFAEFGNPALLEGMLQRYPRLRVNMMHGGIGWPDEARTIMEGYPQVYMDISPVWQFWPGDDGAFRELAAEINGLYEQGLGERIMFGSDNAWFPAHIGMAIEMIEANPYLSAERKRDILYDNAARFLRLSDEQISDDYGR